MRYIVVGGKPFRNYNNTTVFTALNVVGKAQTKKEVKKIVDDHFDDCGGLMMVIDSETGEEANV